MRPIVPTRRPLSPLFSVFGAAIVLVCGLVAPAPVAADPTVRWIPPRISFDDTHLVPQLKYSSETKLGLGAHVLHRFHLAGADSTAPRSEFAVKGLVTTRGDGRSRLGWDLFLGSGRNLIRGKVEFDNIPTRFWGLGPDTPGEAEEIYQAQRLVTYLEWIHRWGRRLEIGVRAEVERANYLSFEPGGLLDTVGYRGTGGDVISGAGLVVNWDSRDRRHSPRRGTLVEILVMGFPDDLGSQLSFNNHSVDWRVYRPLPGDAVLATQVFAYAVRGDPPIWRYAELGGRHHSRGYRKARYVDRVLAAGQAELRLPDWWRLGLVGFAGVANVGPYLHQLRARTVRPTVGGGLRVRIGKRDDLVVRLDAAVGAGSFRLSLRLGDAF